MSDNKPNVPLPIVEWVPSIVPAAAPRPSISDAVRQQIATELRALPPNRRAAVLVIGEERQARAVFAARYGDHFKVAAGGGWVYHEPRPKGYVAVELAW